MKTYYVYILKCSDNSYYTGMTNNLDRRYQEHQLGINPNAYTYYRRPVEIKYYIEFNYVWDAIRYEKQIKKWSRRKKNALIRGEYDKLGEFSKKRFCK